MRQFLEDLRYERPGTYFCGVVVLIVLVLAGVFMALPAAPILRVIGVTGAQSTLGAGVNAIYWSGRVLLNRSSDEAPDRVYGNLEGVSQDGKLIVKVMVQDRLEQRLYGIADTQIVDLRGVAKMVSELRYENPRLDVYHGNQAVVWIKGTPLNVRMIEVGVVKPDPNPPTNIVDSAFAAYYWSQVKGTKEGEGQ